MAARHPELVVIRRADNGGQTAACLDGLARARGPYVVFLDADDYLLPHCLASHVAVHLSSRVHVGFTSGDMLQMVDGQVVLGTNASSCNFIAAGAASKPARGKPAAPRRDLLRPTALDALRGTAPTRSPTASTSCRATSAIGRGRRPAAIASVAMRSISSATPKVSPPSRRRPISISPWPSTPSTAASSSTSRCSPTGSTAPTSSPTGRSCRVASASRASAAPAPPPLARRLLVDQLVGRIERLYPETWMAQTLLATLARIDTTIEDMGPWRGRSYAARAIARRFEPVAATVGRRPALLFMLRRAPRRLKLRLFLEHNRPAA